MNTAAVVLVGSTSEILSLCLTSVCGAVRRFSASRSPLTTLITDYQGSSSPTFSVWRVGARGDTCCSAKQEDATTAAGMPGRGRVPCIALWNPRFGTPPQACVCGKGLFPRDLNISHYYSGNFSPRLICLLLANMHCARRGSSMDTDMSTYILRLGSSSALIPPLSSASPTFRPKEGRINFHCLAGQVPPKRKQDGPPVSLACLEEGCGWQHAEATYNMAQNHAQKGHGNASVCMVAPASDEEIRERKNKQRRARYARMKEQQVSRGESRPIHQFEASLVPHRFGFVTSGDAFSKPRRR